MFVCFVLFFENVYKRCFFKIDNPNAVKSYKILQKLSPKHTARGVAQLPYPIYRQGKACLSKQPPWCAAGDPRLARGRSRVWAPGLAGRQFFSHLPHQTHESVRVNWATLQLCSYHICTRTPLSPNVAKFDRIGQAQNLIKREHCLWVTVQQVIHFDRPVARFDGGGAEPPKSGPFGPQNWTFWTPPPKKNIFGPFCG